MAAHARLVARMVRRSLHAIWGMPEHDQDFDGNKFFKLTKRRLAGNRAPNGPRTNGAPQKDPLSQLRTKESDIYREAGE